MANLPCKHLFTILFDSKSERKALDRDNEKSNFYYYFQVLLKSILKLNIYVVLPISDLFLNDYPTEYNFIHV